MVSEAQFDEKREKIFKVAKCFLENENITIAEVSEKTGIPRSSVQRYLNNNIIQEFLELREITEDPVGLIKEKLAEIKKQGNSKGGKTFAEKHVPLKKEDGKFAGSIKK